jgi:hypothetical protein
VPQGGSHAVSSCTLDNVTPQSFSLGSGRRPLRHIFGSVCDFSDLDLSLQISRAVCIQQSCGYLRRVGRQPHGTVLDVRKELGKPKYELPLFHGREFLFV